MPRVALVTYRGLPALSADDRLALAPLAEHGVRGVAAAWDDPDVDWGAFDALVVRSTWDYHRRPDDFGAWLGRLEAARLAVWNPIPLLRWNANKRYLRDLEAQGIPIVPTRWVESGVTLTLGAILEQEGWREAVVKPTVSASAHETWRASEPPGAAAEARFAAACALGGVMVQRYMPEVAEPGEWSLCFIAGEFSHAVRKRAAPGDFRVQEEHGGSTRPARPPAALVAQAAHALAAAPWPTLYARVDGCEVDGRLVLMELEAVEPSLFLGHEPEAPARFAAAVARAAGQGAHR